MRIRLKNLSIVCFILVGGKSIGQNNLTLTIVSDRYRSEISWELLNSSDLVIADGGNYGADYTTNDEYPLPLINITDLADGEYTFKWYDEYGDGVCCAYGAGYYSLVADENDIVVAYGTQEQTYDFTLPAPIPPITATPLTIDLVQFAEGFSYPVDIKSAGDSRMFVVEQQGKIKIFNPDGSVLPTPYLDITDRVTGNLGEQGLLGLAFHPNYSGNGYFYVNYIKDDGDTRISRFKVSDDDANIANPDSELIIFEADQPYSNHNGGDLQFGPDGYLYAGLGDGGDAGDPDERAQDLSSPMGKMLRFNIDGIEPYEIPTDNPFIGQEGVLPEIWAYGLRNPWRFSFDSENGDLWIGDVGQSLWEEVDYFKNGSANGVNYGWDCYEGFADYEPVTCDGGSAVQDPIHVYPHTSGVSITGGVVYRGAEYPNLYGKYLYADYAFGVIWGITKEDETTFTNQTLKQSAGFLISVFGEDIDKNLYVADYLNGKIYKINDACPFFNPFIAYNDGYLIASDGLNYYWFLNGEQLDSTTNAQILIPTEVGSYYVIVEYEGGCLLQSETEEIISIGVDENNYSNGITIFPNPAKNTITISNKNKFDQAIKIELVDIVGKKVLEWNVVNLTNLQEFDISNIVTGIYNLNISDDNQTIASKKVVVIKN